MTVGKAANGLGNCGARKAATPIQRPEMSPLYSANLRCSFKATSSRMNSVLSSGAVPIRSALSACAAAQGPARRVASGGAKVGASQAYAFTQAKPATAVTKADRGRLLKVNLRSRRSRGAWYAFMGDSLSARGGGCRGLRVALFGCATWQQEVGDAGDDPRFCGLPWPVWAGMQGAMLAKDR